jgi:hypothetical protein
MKKYFNKFAAKIGKSLGSLPILLVVLIVYFLLTLITYFLLRSQEIKYPENQSSFLISYIVATGGDPAPYLQTLEVSFFLYWWILVFHLISWLFIPVVIALAADTTYRLYEQRKYAAKLNLRRKMKNILFAETNLPEEEIVKITNKFNQILEEKENA